MRTILASIPFGNAAGLHHGLLGAVSRWSQGDAEDAESLMVLVVPMVSFIKCLRVLRASL
jgi:hypothetical protein